MKKIVKKLSSNNLLTIHKDLLLKVTNDKLPEEITRNEFHKYYHYMYIVFKKSIRVIQIDFLEVPEPSIKIISTPTVIKKSISNINIHIPERIIKTMTDKYFEFRIINKTRFQLIGISKEDYNNARDKE